MVSDGLRSESFTDAALLGEPMVTTGPFLLKKLTGDRIPLRLAGSFGVFRFEK